MEIDGIYRSKSEDKNTDGNGHSKDQDQDIWVGNNHLIGSCNRDYSYVLNSGRKFAYNFLSYWEFPAN